MPIRIPRHHHARDTELNSVPELHQLRLRHLGRNLRGNPGSHAVPVMVRDDLRIARAAASDDSGRAA